MLFLGLFLLIAIVAGLGFAIKALFWAALVLFIVWALGYGGSYYRRR